MDFHNSRSALLQIYIVIFLHQGSILVVVLLMIGLLEHEIKTSYHLQVSKNNC